MSNLITTDNTVTLASPPGHEGLKLSLIGDLLDAFHSLDIRYCHWKSNEHLAASMAGTTDLDILFDEQGRTGVGNLLSEYGFKKFRAIKEKEYKDIEDFIGLDFPSGKIVHVHAHFKLTLGERYLKGYQLDLENRILDTRVFDIEFGIYRCAPVYEYVLLFFRHALKMRNRDRLKYNFNKNRSCEENILAEYRWLRRRCTNDEIEVLLKSLFVEHTRIYNLVTAEFTYPVLLKLSPLLHRAFKGQRLYSPVKSSLLRWYREMAVKAYHKWSRYSLLPVATQRVHPPGGFIVAIIGADGSGKSTVIENLRATFRKKIDVFQLYMGRGKSGNISWQRKYLNRIKKNYQRRNKKVAPGGSDSVKQKNFRFNLYKCLEALAVARERGKKLKMIQAAKAKGMLVICDRFPQNQLMGYNDGPVLSHLLHSKNFIFRICAKKEAEVYKRAHDNPPDIVFKLIANVDIITARKPSNASGKSLEVKVEGVRQLKFPKSSSVVTIDANRPLSEVLVSVKSQLWSAWNGSSRL